MNAFAFAPFDRWTLFSTCRPASLKLLVYYVRHLSCVLQVFWDGFVLSQLLHPQQSTIVWVLFVLNTDWPVCLLIWMRLLACIVPYGLVYELLVKNCGEFIPVCLLVRWSGSLCSPRALKLIYVDDHDHWQVIWGYSIRFCSASVGGGASHLV